jgi:hypothetical protein
MLFNARTSCINNKDRGKFQVFIETTSFLGRNVNALFELAAGL